MNKIFFTSDTHFNHKNIINYDCRPFDNIEEMNETIISNWNKEVTNDDIVYHLGDFGFGKTEELQDLFIKLNGKITLIVGNHDGTLTNLVNIGFVSVLNKAVINYLHYELILCHKLDYKEITYESHQLNKLFIHGHTHSENKFFDNTINVCINAWEYKPIELKTLINLYKKYKGAKKCNNI